MKIALYEMEHFEIAYVLLRFFENNQHTILVCTNEKCRDYLIELLGPSHVHYRWLLKDESESHRDFIRKMGASLKKETFDLIVYSTVSHNHYFHARFLRQFPKIKSLLVIHAINSLFDEPINGFRSWFRKLGTKQLLQQVSGLAVLSKQMADLLRERSGTIPHLYILPGAIFAGPPQVQKIETVIRLVVPGSIDTKRRNYEDVFELLALAEKSKIRLIVTLAGEPEGEIGKLLLEKALRWQGEYASIVHPPKDQLKPTGFASILLDAHFIWCPAVEKSTAYRDVPEVYGKSKATGNVFDAIRSAKPMICPSSLYLDPALRTSSFTYEEPLQILHFLTELMRYPERYQHWQNAAIDNSSAFTIEKTRQKFLQIFQEKPYS